MPQPENNSLPAMNLPPPVMDPNSGELAKEPQTTEVGKAASIAPETPPQAPMSNQLAQSTGQNQQYDGSTKTTNDVATTTNIVVPDTADDDDLIEKEWVNKAKKIVNANREDPYNQAQQLTVFKADYMKKRYNKIIKISE